MSETSIYLAGPVKEREDSGAAWRERIKSTHDGWFDFIDPLDKYDPSDDQDPSAADIVNADIGMIDSADALLVRYDGEPTWGSPMEVFYAVERKMIPVAIAWTADTEVSPWAQYFADAVRGSVDDALHALNSLVHDVEFEGDTVAGVEAYSAGEDIEQAYAQRDQPESSQLPSGDDLASMLAEDVATLLTDSRDSHGDAVENQEHIADAWSWYLGEDVTGVDVARMMELVKMSRAVVGEYDLDHDRDIAGYASIAAACAVANGEADIDDLQEHAENDLTDYDPEQMIGNIIRQANSQHRRWGGDEDGE